MLTRISLAGAMTLAFVSAAYAQTDVQIGGAINYIADLVVAGALAVIGILSAVITPFLTRWLGNKAAKEANDILVGAAQRGVALARNRVAEYGTNLSVSVQNQIVAGGIAYVIDQFPDLMRKAGANEASVRKLVEATLAEAIGMEASMELMVTDRMAS